MKFVFKMAKDMISDEIIIDASDLEEAQQSLAKKLVLEVWQKVEAKLPAAETRYCSDCNQDFESTGAYKRHRTRMHGVSVADQGDQGVLNPQVFIQWARQIYDNQGKFDYSDISAQFKVDIQRARNVLNQNFLNRPKNPENMPYYIEFNEMFDRMIGDGNGVHWKSKPKMFAKTSKGVATQ
jgi:hypothetical protein